MPISKMTNRAESGEAGGVLIGCFVLKRCAEGVVS